MFTGIIESVGTVKNLKTRGDYRILTIAPAVPFEQVVMGESIACDGACLTVVAFDKDQFTVEASQETITRTTLSSYRSGSKVNLERALIVGGRLGGHMVTGHIDDVGTISAVESAGASACVSITYDVKYNQLVVPKGSVAIDGVSLTVNDVRQGFLTVNIIPHTGNATTACDWNQGDKINIEFDILGKYVQKMTPSAQPDGISRETLLKNGW